MSKLDYRQAAELIRDYETGTTVLRLAAKYSLWPTAVISRLKTAGVYRGRSPGRQKSVSSWIPTPREEILRLMQGRT